ncbi:helicase [Brevibacillus borstelensis]|uniref:HelD family protein n=1 Tax=Brevibacillus borstelensis TaxID=45462 RepID=UPI000F090FD9|nr:UvrD-helicase domain-containing protein [Brevibacillus borstelensis]MED1883951.1 AAA family ATPase [Brevibacillus borstelensis]RNB60741.1 helicase [Brevibacillus borstelensis]GED52091.1 helicase [Brevibacillus borstelensis]
MIENQTEMEEREHLANIVSKLQKALQTIEQKISKAHHEIMESKKYLWENRSELDPAETAANKIDIMLTIDQGEKAVDKERRLRKLIESPYFGRVDFVLDGQSRSDSHYIGVHAFSEEDSQKNLIYDWRSPVASMFYDFEVGRASYPSPAGQVEGEVCLKRQYKIKDGVMQYMIESSLNINDEVLQRELSQTSNEKMKNIVATIQKEQNVIIRNEHSHELIIQGVAGSGKTSVALHRVAFLLYRSKGTITSQNIWIISPNKVFSDYISNILPELGEEKIMEIGIEEIAEKELDGVCKFESFSQQVAELAASNDQSLIERIQYKSGIEMVERLDQFLAHMSEASFVPDDIAFDNVHIAKEDIMRAYRGAANLPIKQRLEKTASIIAANARDENGDKATAATAKKVKTAIKKMFASLNLLVIYKDFYEYMGRPELFKLKKPKMLEFSDVFPLVYMKIHLEGTKGFEEVKHLLVDEMQDYTPVQYAVLSRLFTCKKTILGDCNQSVNPYSSSSITEIKKVFPNAETVELLKSYRSTVEIIRFAQQINPNSRMIPIERHGPSPEIKKASDSSAELEQIKKIIASFQKSEQRTLGIVCKSQSQAEKLYQEIASSGEAVHLLDFGSDQFREGVIVTSSHLAKGLEFDQVLVPFVDAENYKTDMDRSLLYIACTRAMHMLTLTYSGEASPFLLQLVQ